MRILIISTFFPPQNSIASHRPYSWAKYWSKAGHEVVVLTTPKNKITKQPIEVTPCGFQVVEKGYGWLLDWFIQSYKVKQSSTVKSEVPKRDFLKWIFTSWFKHVDQFRINRGIFHYRRAPDFTAPWADIATAWALGQAPWDLVISTYGPHTTHTVGYALRKRNHTKYWIADFRDLWTDDHIFKGLIGFRWYERWLERRYLAMADLLVTVSKPLAETLSKKAGKQCITIENGFEPSDLEGLSIENAFIGRDEKVRLVYTGSIYKTTRDPSPLFEAIRSIHESGKHDAVLDRLEVVFVGGNIEVLNELVSQFRVENWVRLEGFVSREKALRMQRDAHVLLFLESNANGVEGILTGKIFEYLSSETMVWAIGVTPDSSPGQLILQSRGGMVFGNDDKAIAATLVNLLQNPAKEKLHLDHEVLRLYTRERLAMKLLDHVDVP